MDEVAKKKYKGGRKPSTDKVEHRYAVRFNAKDNARFLTLFEQSGMRTKAHFIASRVFGEEFKVITYDASKQEYYAKLSTLYAQFRAIGVNYNQVVKALKANFTEKKAMIALYKLEKLTIQLITVNKKIMEMTQKYEEEWLTKP